MLLLIASFLVVVLPWAVARYLRDGLTLFQQSISTRVAGTINVTDEVSYSNPSIIGYFVYLFKQPAFSGAFIISLCSGFILYRRQKHPLDSSLPELNTNAVLGCIAWMISMPLLLAFIDKKLDWYVFSSYYGAAALTGIMVQSLFQHKEKRWIRAIAVSAVAGLFLFGTISSYIDIEAIENDEEYRAAMEEFLDRRFDSGLHAYIQYSEQEDGEFVTEWTETDYLYAKLYGDVECLSGGVEAFLADEESAIIFIGTSGQASEIESLYMETICLMDDYYVCVFTSY